MLEAEVIIFWVTFFVMSVPQLFFMCMKKANLEDAIKDEEEEEGAEGADEKH